jgi:UDP-hydrolysing UDP-N-acetyl-D-glucosamine 2-epimerase
VLRAIQTDPALRLFLYVSGIHLCQKYGLTVREIEADGFEINERVEVPLSSDTPEAIAKSMGCGLAGFAEVFSRRRPDILVVLGDRFEMFAAALASVPFNIPIAHMGGGDVTTGAIDDALRHGLTKLSHLHFASTEEYAHRIIQMGEEPWRVYVSGEPNVDAFQSMRLLTREELEARHPLRLRDFFLLVTYHPVTLQYEEATWQIRQLLSALQNCNMPIIFTMPNADTANKRIREGIQEFVAANASACAVENLGVESFVSVMALAAAVVGNSSSGILEAASFKLPVVNIGIRQAGRVRSKNVIDVGNTSEEILAGIKQALHPGFRASLSDLLNPYATGFAVPRILHTLKQTTIDADLLQKRFYDLPSSQQPVLTTPQRVTRDLTTPTRDRLRGRT